MVELSTIKTASLFVLAIVSILAIVLFVYVMIDKDLKEESAILKSFPMAQIRYCFWHNEKTFRKMFVTKNKG